MNKGDKNRTVEEESCFAGLRDASVEVVKQIEIAAKRDWQRLIRLLKGGAK